MQHYESEIPEYTSKSFTYILMPLDEKYYNINQNELCDINLEQALSS